MPLRGGEVQPLGCGLQFVSWNLFVGDRRVPAGELRLHILERDGRFHVEVSGHGRLWFRLRQLFEALRFIEKVAVVGLLVTKAGVEEASLRAFGAAVRLLHGAWGRRVAEGYAGGEGRPACRGRGADPVIAWPLGASLVVAGPLAAGLRGGAREVLPRAGDGESLFVQHAP